MAKNDTIAEWKRKLAENEYWALRALERVYREQTTDEQQYGDTKHLNGVGFSGRDAEILTSFAQQYRRNGVLSDKQMAVLHKRIPKYAGQLYRLTYQ